MCFVFHLLECYVVESVLHYLLLLSNFVCIPFLYNPLGQVSAALCISGCMDDILGGIGSLPVASHQPSVCLS